MDWTDFSYPKGASPAYPNTITSPRACLAACAAVKGTNTQFLFEVSEDEGCRCANGVPDDVPLFTSNVTGSAYTGYSIWSVGKPYLRQQAVGKSCSTGVRLSSDQSRDACYRTCLTSIGATPFYFDFGPFGCWCSSYGESCGELIDLPGSEIWVTGPTIPGGRAGECTASNSLNPTCSNLNSATTNKDCSPSPFAGLSGGACAINVDNKPVCVTSEVLDSTSCDDAYTDACNTTSQCQVGYTCIKGCCASGRCFPIAEAAFPFVSVASATRAGRIGAATVSIRIPKVALASDSAGVSVEAMGGLAAAVDAVTGAAAATELPLPMVVETPPAPPSPLPSFTAADDVAAADGGVSSLVPVTMHGGTSDTGAGSASDTAEDASGR